eukprot:TRINITY_DN7691_c0_g1_i1.p2 TRINITY_DN7691_c0_g1~~TRINITY_DN7691_c0_g1_i1.p2  ORF type:complete len:280 (+),score=10.85 TRINITY_DN7691_c0_g1_i1:119-841(+)
MPARKQQKKSKQIEKEESECSESSSSTEESETKSARTRSESQTLSVQTPSITLDSAGGGGTIPLTQFQLEQVRRIMSPSTTPINVQNTNTWLSHLTAGPSINGLLATLKSEYPNSASHPRKVDRVHAHERRTQMAAVKLLLSAFDNRGTVADPSKVLDGIQVLINRMHAARLTTEYSDTEAGTEYECALWEKERSALTNEDFTRIDGRVARRLAKKQKANPPKRSGSTSNQPKRKKTESR